MELANRAAVVTGGSRGIGRAIALALAKRRANVVAAARNADSVAQVADEIRALGRRAAAVACDVTSPASISRLSQVARDELGAIDILVNNAGIASSAPIKTLTLEDWNRVMAVNATGTFLCTQAFLAGMAERRWGRVVNVASITSRMGSPYIAAYTASKHAVLGFTRVVAAEYAARNVTANAVCPGYVNTDMTTDSVG